MNYTEITLFTKEEVQQQHVSGAIASGLFMIRPVIRNLVIGKDAATRNTQLKFPFKEVVGFDLSFRVVPTIQSINGAFQDALSVGNNLKIDHPARMEDWDTAPRSIHFKSVEAALAATASLHKEGIIPRIPTMTHSHSHNVSSQVDYMLSFANVFGRLPRDSEKINLKSISHILYAMDRDGEKLKYPMKALQKVDHYRAMFTEVQTKDMTELEQFIYDQNDRSSDSFYSIYFRILCKFVNGETVLNKLDRILDQEAKDQEEEEEHLLYKMRRSLLARKQSLLSNIADHIRAPFTQKSENFFLKYYKRERLHTLLDLCLMVEEPDFPQSGNWSIFENYMVQVASRKQVIEVDLRLQKKGFAWNQLRVDLPMTTIEYEGTTVRMLEAQDSTALALGEITSCCQRLNGVGESCMFEGLVNPFSGFLVFEQEGSIIAQAWVWQSSTDALVLDNIEFGNFKGVKSIKSALEKWLHASPFNDIQVGQGYMEIEFGGDTVKTKDMSWFKERVWEKDLYTDAKSRKWLKQEGVITL